jgi:thiamine pyrophosphokinase
VIFYDQQKIYAVSSGFGKWKPGSEIINILSKTTSLKTAELEEIGEDQYKTIADGFFTLEFDEPLLFIAESL